MFRHKWVCLDLILNFLLPCHVGTAGQETWAAVLGPGQTAAKSLKIGPKLRPPKPMQFLNDFARSPLFLNYFWHVTILRSYFFFFNSPKWQVRSANDPFQYLLELRRSSFSCARGPALSEWPTWIEWTTHLVLTGTSWHVMSCEPCKSLV